MQRPNRKKSQRAPGASRPLGSEPVVSPGASRPLGPEPVVSPGASRPLGPEPVVSPGAPRPKGSRPVVSPGASRPKGSRPVVSGRNQDPMSGVQQITTGLQTLGTGVSQSKPIGHEAKKGRKQIDYEASRTLGSQLIIQNNGKQGTSGKAVKLLANYFPITSYTNWCLYQYRVDFNPEDERLGIKKGLLAQHRERLGGYLFDGTMLFSGSRYDPPTFELTSIRRSDDQVVIITVKFTNVIETGDYAYIQVFNLLLRSCLRHLKLTLVGRNFYDQNAKIDMPQNKLQLWPGYVTTIGRFEDNILLCAEISTKVMRQDKVLDFLKLCAADRNRNKYWMRNFKEGVVGTTVMTVYNNETYKIDDVDENSYPTSEFSKKDGSKITYMQYYKERWNITIRDGKQPMLVSKNKRSIKEFGEEILVHLVPELCIMTGITDTMRKDKRLMSEIAIHTRVNPKERMDRLVHFANRLLKTPDSVTELKQWNLTLSNKLVELTGRTLPPENIYSRTKSYDGGVEADWTKDLRTLPMLTSAVVKHWVILAPKDCCREVDAFVQTLIKAAQGMAFVLPGPKIVQMNDGKSNTFLTHLEHVINQSNPAFILCVIQSTRGDIYNLIKRKLCIDRAVPSQVVLLKNVQNNNLSVCTKIAIQINCKLGGAPWLVKIPIRGLMIVGFDVCHDTQNKNKSFGALVSTMNDTHTSYFSCVEPHAKGQELSIYFATGITKALAKYRAKNGTLPTSIIVYRDGVGEGQISDVYNIEVKLMKDACQNLYGPKSVPFTFVIVTKRISARFFAPSVNGPRNPQSGTVIDTVVTDPTKYDFFLVSQHVKQGTVTPTHYQVIEDTVGLLPDRMQRLTYMLTHMYFNWSGTVRVPAPCQLAHKLAFLTSQSLGRSAHSGLDELLYFL